MQNQRCVANFLDENRSNNSIYIDKRNQDTVKPHKAWVPSWTNTSNIRIACFDSNFVLKDILLPDLMSNSSSVTRRYDYPKVYYL